MDTRKECQDKMGQEYQECIDRIEELEKKAKNEYDEQIENLKKKRQSIQEKFDKMINSDESRWSGAKDEAQNALADLQDALEKSYARFKK